MNESNSATMYRFIFTLVILVLLSAVYGQPPPKLDSEPQKMYSGVRESRNLFDFLQQRRKRETSHVLWPPKREMLELTKSETHDRSKREMLAPLRRNIFANIGRDLFHKGT